MAAGNVPELRCLALLALAVVLSCLVPVSSKLPQPGPLEASTATPLQAVHGTAIAAGDQQAAEAGAVSSLQRSCTYTLKVKTSCASPRRSSDAVSLAFGDAYRNEVYVARLTPRPGFERCATDTFRVSGPCGYGVCYLYLRRAGREGWTPEWVRVYEPTSDTPSTFYYGGDALPAGVWYGFNRCVRRGDADGDAASSLAAAQSM